MTARLRKIRTMPSKIIFIYGIVVGKLWDIFYSKCCIWSKWTLSDASGLISQLSSSAMNADRKEPLADVFTWIYDIRSDSVLSLSPPPSFMRGWCSSVIPNWCPNWPTALPSVGKLRTPPSSFCHQQGTARAHDRRVSCVCQVIGLTGSKEVEVMTGVCAHNGFSKGLRELSKFIGNAFFQQIFMELQNCINIL